jgi:hypothetical protein
MLHLRKVDATHLQQCLQAAGRSDYNIGSLLHTLLLAGKPRTISAAINGDA